MPTVISIKQTLSSQLLFIILMKLLRCLTGVYTGVLTLLSPSLRLVIYKYFLAMNEAKPDSKLLNTTWYLTAVKLEEERIAQRIQSLSSAGY